MFAVFVMAVFNIGKIYYDYNKADNIYEVMQDEYVATKDVESNSEATQGNDEQPPKSTEPPIAIDFDALLNRNKDVIGWLYCPDTVINYPVVQGKNNDQYLRKDLDGKYLVSGTLFADYRNGELNEDANYIIYGHNMKNGTMFSSLAKYKQQSYYNLASNRQMNLPKTFKIMLKKLQLHINTQEWWNTQMKFQKPSAVKQGELTQRKSPCPS